jgi:hypothetical protein
LDLTDSYKTLAYPSPEILYKEKNSKFLAMLSHGVRIRNQIYYRTVAQKHYNAHFCYAFQLGTETFTFRANDDGEPSNSAGMPIYGQIQSFGLTNVLVVVVRFLAGQRWALAGSFLLIARRRKWLWRLRNRRKTIDIHYLISFDYKNMNKVMRGDKEKT